MERRVPQELARKCHSLPGHRAGTGGLQSKPDFKSELRTNGFLRISLSAKDKVRRFNNLYCHFTIDNLRKAFLAQDASKASGIDGVTKHRYGKNLEENLKDLVTRLHKGTYRPLPKRGVSIPKADGKTRPIAVSSFEDKLVEWVLARILSSVYEPIFIKNSFGFRPSRSADDAISFAYCSLKGGKRPYVVEIDIERFFDSVSHRKLMHLVGKRISDRRILGLILRQLRAGVFNETCDLKLADLGTAQGSIVSPVLANVFLHYALDDWFMENYSNAKYPVEEALIVRYADDAIFIFRKEDKAQNFLLSLKTRLEKFGLKVHEDKSGIIRFGKLHGNVFHFLGFTFYWRKDPGATRRSLWVKTERKRLYKKIQDYKVWIKENRCQLPTAAIWDRTARKLRGHYNYYGWATNRGRLNHFYYIVVHLLFKWMNRRSQKRSYSWVGFKERLRNLPLPKPPESSKLKNFYKRSLYDGVL